MRTNTTNKTDKTYTTYIINKNYTIRALASVITLGVVLGGIVSPAGAAGSAADKADLPNFHQVSPGIYRSAAPTEKGLHTLKTMGVKTVIDLRIAPKTVAIERKQLAALGIRDINLPMSGKPPTDAQIAAFRRTLADPAAQPILVHCQHGADRTGTMIGIYRETVDGWSYDQTFKEMRKYGFNPHWKDLAATVKRFAPGK